MSQLASGENVKRRLADTTIAWREQTGHRIVYWGGLAHTTNGWAIGRNAGSYLRERFASGYVSIALTFHHGLLPLHVDDPPADYIEAVLGAVDLDTYTCWIYKEAGLSQREDGWMRPRKRA